jgi:hypothetical protein
VIFGLLAQRHLDRLSKTELGFGDMKRENDRLKSEQAKLRDVNVELAGKIVGASSTLGSLYRYAKNLNTSDIGKIYKGLAEMIKEVIKADEVSVWDVAEGKPRLAVHMGGPAQKASPPSLTRELAKLFDQNGVLALHDIPEAQRPKGFPYLIGRINEGKSGKAIALLTIDKMPLAKYTPETVRLFSMVVDWAGNSINNARSLGNASDADRQGSFAAEVTSGRLSVSPEDQSRIRQRPQASEHSNTAPLVKGGESAGREPSRLSRRPQKADQDSWGLGGGQEESAQELTHLLREADNLLDGYSPLNKGREEPAGRRPRVEKGDPDAEEMMEHIEQTFISNPELGKLLSEVSKHMPDDKKG